MMVHVTAITVNHRGTAMFSKRWSQNLRTARPGRRFQPALEALELRDNPSTLFVDAHNLGGADGSAGHPYATIQAAVDVAPLDTIIDVAAGTYHENVTITDNSVGLQGGFTGGSTAGYAAGQPGDFAASDPAAQVTTIAAPSADAPVIFLNNGTQQTLKIDGFTISGGLHGIYVLADSEQPSEITISHNIIENNGPAALQPGGGMFYFFGGGIFSDKAILTVTNNIVRHNNANRGGGVFLGSNSDYTITDNMIDSNGGWDDHGGGGVLNPLPATAPGSGTFARNTISNNVAAQAFNYGWAGGVLVAGNNDPASLKTVTLTDNIFTGNSAPTAGGAFFADNGVTVVLDHDLIYKNSTQTIGGGAIYVDGDGGGTGSFLTMVNCTVADNTNAGQNQGNGIYIEEFSTATVTNCIFWNNTQDFYVAPDSSITITYSDSQQVQAGTGNLNQDPLFANPAAGDYHEKSSGGRFDPTAQGGAGGFVQDAVSSPIIDAGDPASTFARETAPNGGRINMGVYGNTPQASRQPAAIASQLQFAATLTNGAAGQHLPDFQVNVEDAFGNTVAGSSATITIAVVGPGGFTSGAVMTPAGNGVADFPDLVLQTAGSYKLTASAPGLASMTSNSFTVTAGPVATLVFEPIATTVTAGQALADLKVHVQDAYGNPLDGTMVSVTGDGPGTLAAGEPNAQTVAGVATFSGLTWNKAGPYTLTPHSAAVGGAAGSFTVAPAAAAALTLEPVPSSIRAGQALPDIKVDVRDAFGNLVAGSIPVTLAVQGPAAPATGNTTAQSSGGSAVFSGLSFHQVGTYSLTALAAGLSAPPPASIVVVPGDAARLVFQSLPSAGAAGKPLADIVVTVLDSFGNATTGSLQVTLTLTGPSTLTATATASNGSATFSGLVPAQGGSYMITVSSGSLAQSVSNGLPVSAAVAVQVRFVSAPTTGHAGKSLPILKLQLLDAGGHPVAAGILATLRLKSGRLLGTTQARTDRRGTVTFKGLHIRKAGRYILVVTIPGHHNFTRRVNILPT